MQVPETPEVAAGSQRADSQFERTANEMRHLSPLLVAAAFAVLVVGMAVQAALAAKWTALAVALVGLVGPWLLVRSERYRLVGVRTGNRGAFGRQLLCLVGSVLIVALTVWGASSLLWPRP